MKNIINNILIYLNFINKKALIIIKTVNILKFAVNSNMPEYVMSITSDKDESEIIDTELSKCMKRVSNDYMGWELDCIEKIIKKLKTIEPKHRTSFWILLAAELNTGSNIKQLETAIIETQKAYLFFKQHTTV